MTRLFLRFYFGVLVVLFLAWYIHGKVTEQRAYADRARVITTAHRGGALMVAEELNAAGSPERRDATLAQLQKRFDYKLQIIPVDELTEPARGNMRRGKKVAYDRDTVIAALAEGDSVVRLGSFPNYTRQQIEASLAGWMRLAKDRFDAVPQEERQMVLKELQDQFAISITIGELSEIPARGRARVTASDENVAFYSPGDDTYYSAIQLADDGQVVIFGPFPSFQNLEQKVAATTLALVLLPAALAIALLLRPVARQLRQLENAAEAIAGGDLSARVDQERMKSARPLAQAFNHMAGRTESLVRTQRELLQAVSHELRTPLSRMRFAIDLIGTAKSDEEREQRLESLDAATMELDGLVGELLSYVRLETAEPRVEQEVLMVGDILDGVVTKFDTLYPNVSFQHDELSRDFVWADRHGFRRAIANLVSNAGRHAKAQVSIHSSSRDGMTVIDVDDDGPGIPLSDRERVFEPFVRLGGEQQTENTPANSDSAVGSASVGVGLGLALVQRIVLQNGGNVEILSSPTGGCRMRTTWHSRDI